MSHDRGVAIKLSDELFMNLNNSPPNDENDDGVGLNFTPHLINPLIPFKVSLVTKSCVIFMVNPNFKSMVTKP